MNHEEHKKAVNDFFEVARRENPEKYSEVCRRYPVASRRRIATIKKTEYTVGLLGMQPTQISGKLTTMYDSISDDDNEE